MVVDYDTWSRNPPFPAFLLLSLVRQSLLYLSLPHFIVLVLTRLHHGRTKVRCKYTLPFLAPIYGSGARLGGPVSHLNVGRMCKDGVRAEL